MAMTESMSAVGACPLSATTACVGGLGGGGGSTWRVVRSVGTSLVPVGAGFWTMLVGLSAAETGLTVPLVGLPAEGTGRTVPVWGAWIKRLPAPNELPAPIWLLIVPPPMCPPIAAPPPPWAKA